jgi:hypothetical protein
MQIQKQAANAINIAISKQQMNSARQSPMNYMDLRNGQPQAKNCFGQGVTETPIINPVDQTKQLYIDVNLDEDSCYGNPIANSPILKVLPTPKAQQPGCEMGTPPCEMMPYQPQLNLYQCAQPGLHMTQSNHVQTPDASTPQTALVLPKHENQLGKTL